MVCFWLELIWGFWSKAKKQRMDRFFLAGWLPTWLHEIYYLPPAVTSCWPHNSWNFLQGPHNGSVLVHSTSMPYYEFPRFFCHRYCIVKLEKATLGAANQMRVKLHSTLWLLSLKNEFFFQLSVVYIVNFQIFFVFIQVYDKNIWIGQSHGQGSQTNNEEIFHKADVNPLIN